MTTRFLLALPYAVSLSTELSAVDNQMRQGSVVPPFWEWAPPPAS
jgi:hypothetical protein